jgi:hypothetical protein
LYYIILPSVNIPLAPIANRRERESPVFQSFQKSKIYVQTTRICLGSLFFVLKKSEITTCQFGRLQRKLYLCRKLLKIEIRTKSKEQGTKTDVAVYALSFTRRRESPVFQSFQSLCLSSFV